jgi:hypothetical protein
MFHRGRDQSTSDQDPGRSSSHRTGTPSDWDRLAELDIALHSDESDLLLVSGSGAPLQHHEASSDSLPDQGVESHTNEESGFGPTALARLGKGNAADINRLSGRK